MAAPTIGTNAHEQVASPSSGTRHRSYSVSKGSAKGLIVMITHRSNGFGLSYDPTDTVNYPHTYGGVNIPVAAHTNVGTGQAATILFLDDLSSVASSTLAISGEAGALMLNVWYGLINHTGLVELLDSGTGTTSVSLDTGVVDGLAFACAAGGSEISSGGSQTIIWDTDFFGPYHSEGSYKDLTGSGSMSESSALAMAAAVVGGVDVEIVFSTRIEVETGFVAGFSIEAPSDVLWQPTRIWLEVGLNEGFRMVADGPYQVMLVPLDLPHETTQTTVDGSEGDILTYHEAERPTWERAVPSALGSWWWYDTGTVAPPDTGDVRTDGALTVSSSGTIWLHNVDDGGLDWAALSIEADDEIYIRNLTRDGGALAQYNIDSVTDSGDYWTLAVTRIGEQGTLVKNKRVAVTLVRRGASGGPHSHDAEDITYDNTTSGLTATDVQAAIDELEAAGGGGGYPPALRVYLWENFR